MNNSQKQRELSKEGYKTFLLLLVWVLIAGNLVHFLVRLPMYTTHRGSGRRGFEIVAKISSQSIGKHKVKNT